MENSNNIPKFIEGGLGVDDRGILSFVNLFDFKEIKRFYVVENFSTDIVRAFHGHLKETKYAFAVAGSVLLVAVLMDYTKNPNKTNQVYRFVLSAKKPGVLYIPAGYANGFRSLEPGTKIIFFSTAALEESKNDDYRFPYNYWGSEIWSVEHR